MSVKFAPAAAACSTLDPEKLFTEADFSGGGAIIAAVSGGGDSLALLFLLYDFLRARGQEKRLLAVSIDHGLRAESAAEAAYVGALCAEAGIGHKTLLWQGAKPRAGLQAAARAARYDLLARAAAGGGVICAAHTLDDQAETYLMRKARLKPPAAADAVAARGLACMARRSMLGGKTALLRPLLGVRRAALRAFLTERGVKWLDDPSNDNRHYERVRIRQAMTEAQALSAAAAAAEAGQARQALSAAAAKLGEALHLRAEGRGAERCFSLDLTFLQREKPAADNTAPLYLLLAVCAALSGGKAYISPDNARLRRFLPLLSEDGKGEKPSRISVSGAVLEKRRHILRVWREMRRSAPENAAPAAAESALFAGITPSYDAPLAALFAHKRQGQE